MPEICEAEKLKSQLQPWVTKRVRHLLAVPDANGKIHAAKLVRNQPPGTLSEKIKGAVVSKVDRVGKQLAIQFDNSWWLQIHLGHTGWWLPDNYLAEQDTKTAPIYQNFIHGLPKSTIRAKLEFTNASRHSFYDPRTFSRWYMFTNTEFLQNYLNNFGADWLKCDPRSLTEDLLEAAKKRPRSTIKSLLLDQKVTCGLGNYLVNECLHRACINPFSQTGALERDQLIFLVGITRGFISKCMSMDDHSHWEVFQRAGEMCQTCHTTRISRQKDSSAPTEKRASYFCETCQPVRKL